MWQAVKNKKDPSLTTKPDLLVIDGGKGQVSSVHSVLVELGLTSIPMIGIAKREEEIFVAGNKIPLICAKDSPANQLLQRLRNEAHRFANSIREKQGLASMQHSVLDDIPGIGPATKKKLLEQFGSVESMKQADKTELLKFLTEEQISLLT